MALWTNCNYCGARIREDSAHWTACPEEITDMATNIQTQELKAAIKAHPNYIFEDSELDTESKILKAATKLINDYAKNDKIVEPPSFVPFQPGFFAK